MDDTVKTGGKGSNFSEGEPENLIHVDFRRGRLDAPGSQEFMSSPGISMEDEIDRLKLVAKRHNSVLRTLYGIITDLMTSMDSRIENLEKYLETVDTGVS